MTDDEVLELVLTGIHDPARRLVNQLPEHPRFMDHYCNTI
jgi:hypothetical protein